MSKYVYPAIFTPEKKGKYSVEFPDLEGCYTSGDDLADAMYMAEDVLAFTLYSLEKRKEPIPTPSDITVIFEYPENSFVNYIVCDTIEYQKRNNNKAVKKTLTIPEWLNEKATEAGINFSQVLQEGLKAKLGVY
jgi:predicted RNase H-like HicB family nuclease